MKYPKIFGGFGLKIKFTNYLGVMVEAFIVGYVCTSLFYLLSGSLEMKKNIIKCVNYNESVYKESIFNNTRTIESIDTVNHIIVYKYADGSVISLPDSAQTDNF